MSTPRKVLVFPAGTEIGLEIARCLAYSKHFRPVGVNSILDHSEMLFPELVADAPRADDPGLADYLLALARRTGAELVLPAHDEAMAAVATLREHGLLVVGPDPELASILRLKSATYDALDGCEGGAEDFLPRRYTAQTLPESGYPLFGRPDRGQGSVGAKRLENREQALAFLSGPRPGIVTEFLPGAEYTVDCYSDRTGQILSLIARERLRIRSGICVRVAEAAPQLFRSVAERINARLAPHGPWFFQLKRDASGTPRLMEVANRIAGTMGYDRVRGLNLVEMALHEATGLTVAPPLPGPCPDFSYDRALCERVRWRSPLPEQVYVDFDDTVVLPDGRLNHELVGVLFGLKSRGVEVVLLSRHRGDLGEFLVRLGLTGLFARVHHMDRAGCKASCMPEAAFTVFVDDSFAERQAVARLRPQALCIGPESLALLAGALAPE